jgi:hypothetical protein
MKKYVSERGFLTEEGKLLVHRFSTEVEEILNIASSENELRLVGSILDSIIGNKVASRIQRTKK